MYAFAEISGCRSAVAESESRDHIAFGCGAETCATARQSFASYLFPQMEFCRFDFHAFRIGFDLRNDGIYFFRFKVNEIVHEPLGFYNMFCQTCEIKRCLKGERIVDVAVEVDGQQAATVVRAQRYLTARIGRHRAETEIGVAVGYGFADYRVPEEHARFCRLPGVVYDLRP